MQDNYHHKKRQPGMAQIGVPLKEQKCKQYNMLKSFFFFEKIKIPTAPRKALKEPFELPKVLS